MERSMTTGYAIVVMGLVIVMYAIAGASAGFPMGIKTAGALISFGGFIVSLGFLSAGFWSTEGNALRTALIVMGGVTIIAMISLLG